jgi:D-beta-D-heptose 7-phosphate kinase/D-beta-D-heptose 1-phosphate adenosyltransferase
MQVRSYASKIKSSRGLKRILSQARQFSSKKAKTVVFTNGCFDLLHKGHVSMLEKARMQGDLLVVALNSDASVSRLKGPERPLNALAERLEVVAALESVDFVTWFEEDTPYQIIQSLRPDVLVKGGDWKVSQIVGAQDVIAWGGKVKSLPYLDGKSTTRLIALARGQKLPIS